MAPPTLAEVRFLLCALSHMHMHTHSHAFTQALTQAHTPPPVISVQSRGVLEAFLARSWDFPLTSWRPSVPPAELIVIHIKGMEKGNLGLVIPYPLLFPSHCFSPSLSLFSASSLLKECSLQKTHQDAASPAASGSWSHPGCLQLVDQLPKL